VKAAAGCSSIIWSDCRRGARSSRRRTDLPLRQRRQEARRRHAKFLSALERAQDCLGDLNDIAVHEERITAIANRRGQSSRRGGSSKRAFAAGLLTGREDARLDAVVASASDAHAALVKIKPFWRLARRFALARNCPPMWSQA
jgi:hypothetical protein